MLQRPDADAGGALREQPVGEFGDPRLGRVQDQEPVGTRILARGGPAPNSAPADSTIAAVAPGSRTRSSREWRASSAAATRISSARAVARADGVQDAPSEATRLACERRITPSSSTFSALAASVAPVVVMSTMSSAPPAAGAPSVAPEALDDAIVADAVLGEKAAGQIDVFGRDPHPLAAPGAEGGGDVLEIGHGAHVDPGLRRGDDDIGAAEAERRQQSEALVGVGDLLAHEILAGDAEMRGAGGELADDFGRREKRDLDAGEAGDRAAIIARAAPLHEFEARAGEEGGGVLLQPPLRGNREDQRGGRGHLSAPGAAIDKIAAPTAGMACARAEPAREAVVAAAADRRLAVGAAGVDRLEHKAGVIIEIAHEGGREAIARPACRARR